MERFTTLARSAKSTFSQINIIIVTTKKKKTTTTTTKKRTKNTEGDDGEYE